MEKQVTTDKLHIAVMKHLFWGVREAITELSEKLSDLEACYEDDLEKHDKPHAEEGECSKTCLKTLNLANRVEKLEKMHIFEGNIEL